LDIRGIDKARVLKALFNHSTFISPVAQLTGQTRGNLSTEEARDTLASQGPYLYFDYLFGRLLKVDLSSDDINLRLYDRDNGVGAGEWAILDELTAPGAD
jgi:hypothetical protein